MARLDSCCAKGRTNENVDACAPASAQTLPWCKLRMNLQIASPRPPPDLSWPPEYEVYSSKIFSMWSIGTPGPESRISTRNEFGACILQIRRSPFVTELASLPRRSQKYG